MRPASVPIRVRNGVAPGVTLIDVNTAIAPHLDAIGVALTKCHRARLNIGELVAVVGDHISALMSRRDALTRWPGFSDFLDSTPAQHLPVIFAMAGECAVAYLAIVTLLRGGVA